MNQTTTRRDLLRFGTSAAAYAAGAAIVTGGIALASEAKSATPGVSPALLKAIADFERHDAALDRFYRDTFNPAIDRHNAATLAIPHVRMVGPPIGAGHELILDSNDPHKVGFARNIARQPAKLASQEPQWQARRKLCRSFTAAVQRRNRTLARIDRDTGCIAADEQETRFYDERKSIKLEVLNFPVASLADLAAKLAFIERDEGMDGDDLLPLVMADVARLSGGEA
jgi:hypothetical protein